MADYNSSYSGAQIDAAVAAVRGATSLATAGSPALITSGGVANAIASIRGGTIEHWEAEKRDDAPLSSLKGEFFRVGSFVFFHLRAVTSAELRPLPPSSWPELGIVFRYDSDWSLGRVLINANDVSSNAVYRLRIAYRVITVGNVTQGRTELQVIDTVPSGKDLSILGFYDASLNFPPW